MKCIIVVVLSLIVYVANGQTYPLTLPAYNLGLLSEYTIQAKVVENNIYEYTIQKVDDATKVKTFTLRPNNLAAFKTNVEAKFNELLSDEPAAVKDEKLFKFVRGPEGVKSLDQLFYQFVASEIAIDSHDYRPEAGKIYFAKTFRPRFDQSGLASSVVDFKLDSAYSRGVIGVNKKVEAFDDELRSMRFFYRPDSPDQQSIFQAQFQPLESELNALTRIANSKKGTAPTKTDSVRIFEAKLINFQAKIREADKRDSYKAFDPIKVSYTPDDKFNLNYGNISTNNLRRKKARRRYRNLVDHIPLPESYQLRDVEIEFNEGFIENIMVVGEKTDKNGDVIPSETLKFENKYPIGFSTKRDFSVLYDTYLYARKDTSYLSLKLSDVIQRYEQKHEVDRRDYSPANEVVQFSWSKHPTGVLAVSKETTSKLFELKTFSDFVGFDQSAPNGLIQVELEKRINIVSRRKPFRNGSWGIFQFITPFALKSKFEDNNKHLVLDVRDNFENNQYRPIKFTSTLELKRYENFSVGTDLNLLLVDFPTVKLTYYINSGFRYGRVAVRDSVRVFENGGPPTNNGFFNEFGVNTYQLMPVKAMVEFKTDERYTVNLSWSLNLYYLRDNSFLQIANIPTFKDGDNIATHKETIFHNVNLGASFKPTSEGQGRLFFRYRYNWQQGFWRTGFHQAQVGYSIPLTKNLKAPAAEKKK